LVHLVVGVARPEVGNAYPLATSDRSAVAESKGAGIVVNLAFRARGIAALSPSMRSKRDIIAPSAGQSYDAVLADVVRLVEAARSAAARSVNAVMTATYWAIGRSIVEQEQKGATGAGYGEELVPQLSRDLQARFGRGFGRANLLQMRAFFLAYRDIVRTVSGVSSKPSLPAARSPDRQPILRTHRAVEKQGIDAPQGSGENPEGRGDTGGRDQATVRPRVSRP
jgi:hypothetical protein